MKTTVGLFALFALTLVGDARYVSFPTYQQMYDRADFVVIARPTSTNDTAERMTLPGLGVPVEAVGVETTFSVQTVVKGSHATPSQFVLHHYRQLGPAAASSPVGQPHLVSFDPREAKSSLLFLTREADGRLAPINGPTDPGLGGIVPMDQIDLIAVAKPASPKQQFDEVISTNSGPPAILVGYRTEFAVDRVIHGKKGQTKVALQYFDDVAHEGPEGRIPFPRRIPFEPEKEQSFLLILKRLDARYFGPVLNPGHVGRETYPHEFSVIKLP